MIIVGDRVYVAQFSDRGIVRAIMCDVLMRGSPTVIVDLDTGKAVVTMLPECFLLTRGPDDVELPL